VHRVRAVGDRPPRIALFTALAGAKTPTWSQAFLREKTAAQLAVGQAEGLVRAGRAFLTETLRERWATVTGGAALSWEQRGLLWLASTQAATQAVQAVELLFTAAGASAVYASTGFGALAYATCGRRPSTFA